MWETNKNKQKGMGEKMLNIFFFSYYFCAYPPLRDHFPISCIISFFISFVFQAPDRSLAQGAN